MSVFSVKISIHQHTKKYFLYSPSINFSVVQAVLLTVNQLTPSCRDATCFVPSRHVHLAVLQPRLVQSIRIYLACLAWLFVVAVPAQAQSSIGGNLETKRDLPSTKHVIEEVHSYRLANED